MALCLDGHSDKLLAEELNPGLCGDVPRRAQQAAPPRGRSPRERFADPAWRVVRTYLTRAVTTATALFSPQGRAASHPQDLARERDLGGIGETLSAMSCPRPSALSRYPFSSLLFLFSVSLSFLAFHLPPIFLFRFCGL